MLRNGSRSCEVIFDPDGKRARIAELEKLSAKADFWSSPEQAQEVMKERSTLERAVERFDRMNGVIEDASVLLDLTSEEEDEELDKELDEKLESIVTTIGQLEFELMLQDEDDPRGAIVSINAGAGGTEAQDWAEMLLRMYLRWSERRGYETEILDILDGEEAGIKSVTFTTKGDYAFGYLKAEIGIHRLVRISPFDAGGRRHTSFASVFVFPEIGEETPIEINESDVKVDTYRSSGAGGQHVNKTDSAVRLTHLPTGIVVQCQSERSQHKNRAMAYKVLRARLYEKEKAEHASRRDEIHKEHKEIAWGSQIRSYVLQPYRMVKDHRTNIEIGNVDAVLDGDLDRLIQGYLIQKQEA